jgi:hypothetical protein
MNDRLLGPHPETLTIEALCAPGVELALNI